jgi:hypothetical protein
MPERSDESIVINDNTLELKIDEFDEIVSIQLLSITGQLVRTSYTNHLDLTGLPSGVYTTVVNTENKRISKKIVLL